MPRLLAPVSAAPMLAILALLVSCSGDTPGNATGPEPSNPTPGFTLRFSTQPADTEAGATIATVRVTVLDASGQPASSASGSIVVALDGPSGATLSGTTTATVSGGVATFDDLSITRAAANYRLAASGAGGAVTLSNPFEIRAGAPVRLEWSEYPHDFALGTTFSAAVRAQDTYGNVVSDPALFVQAQLVHQNLPNIDLGTGSLADGEARFADVEVRTRDQSYQLFATMDGLEAASPRFDVFLPALDLDVGQSHACVIADVHAHLGSPVEAGHVYCWGHNLHGQIRRRIILPIDEFPRPTSFAIDVRTSEFKGTRIAVAERSTCMIDTADQLWCWGSNGDGELGQGDTNPRSGAVQVPAWPGLTDIDAGIRHMCALAEPGAFCWGNNSWGQVNPESAIDPYWPTQIGSSTTVQVNAGTAHTCLRAGGRIECRGDSRHGRLGGGSQGSGPSVETVAGTTQFVDVGAGSQHTCGLDENGAAFCWGRNTVGLLGDGSEFDSSTPTAVLMPDGVAFASISVGFNVSCGLDSEGAAYCWGFNLWGELGATNVLRPTPVGGSLRFSKIVPGFFTSCGITLERRVYCWGRGFLLGGHSGNTQEPVPIN